MAKHLIIKNRKFCNVGTSRGFLIPKPFYDGSLTNGLDLKKQYDLVIIESKDNGNRHDE